MLKTDELNLRFRSEVRQSNLKTNKNHPLQAQGDHALGADTHMKSFSTGFTFHWPIQKSKKSIFLSLGPDFDGCVFLYRTLSIAFN